MPKRKLNYGGYRNPHPILPIHPISVRIPVTVQLIRDGEIETVKIGPTTLIPMDSLERLIASRRSENVILDNQSGY